MKILLVHNFYGSTSPSGENKVFEAEKDLLCVRGHEVETFTRHSDNIRNKGLIGSIQGALATPWNPWMTWAIKQKVARFHPDVVHVHNTFPLISPGIFHAIGTRSARVMTLHNYRLFCATALMIRNQKVCKLCIDNKSVMPSLQYRCYRNSFFATAPLALNIALHRRLGTWTNQVDAFSVMTEDQRNLVIEAGLPAEKVFIKPNFYKHNKKPLPWSQRNGYALYIGRLTEEKGIRHLIKAWLEWGIEAPSLHIIGDGPLKRSLEQDVYQYASGKITFLGFVSDDEKDKQLSEANLLIMPSLEYTETFGLVLIEAFSHGVPTAVSDVVPLNSVSINGLTGFTFKPANPISLLEKVRTAWNTPGLLEQLGQAAWTEFMAKYTKNANYRALLNIYSKAMNVRNCKL